jgi:acyl-CoA synthetase (AMP-forming)/AMP-acid ligase II
VTHILREQANSKPAEVALPDGDTSYSWGELADVCEQAVQALASLHLAAGQRVAVIARSDEWSPDKVRRTIDLASAGVVLLELPTCTAVIDDIGTGGWRVAGKGNVIVHRDGKLSDISALPEAVV